MFDNLGNEMGIGDKVIFENGKTAGVITHVLEEPLDLETWGLEEMGIMVESETFGMAFLPVSCFIDQEVQVGAGSNVANGDKH